MDIHQSVAKYIQKGIHKYYYKPKITKECNLYQLLNFKNDKFILKPEHLIYFLYYEIYCISHYWTNQNYITLNFFLHFFYITYHLESILCNEYKYKSEFDTGLLKEISYYLYHFLIFHKINQYERDSMEKIFYIGSLSFFSFMINYHETHMDRLKAIEERRESEHTIRKLFIFTPNKNTLKKICHYTRHFTFSNFLFYLSFILLFVVSS